MVIYKIKDKKMNFLTTNMAQATTMTSREIAELTGKRHDHVMRDITAMLTQLHGDGGVPKFGDTYTNEQNGQTYPMFALPYEETVCLLTGYDAKARMAVIKRWQELEKPKQKTRVELARENLALEVEIEAKALQIENLSTALDTLKDWSSILKIAKLNKVSEKTMSWHKLKAASETLGFVVKKAESPRFGFQNLYHSAAFKYCYPHLKSI
jgi:phage regulator Rha-like protein